MVELARSLDTGCSLQAFKSAFTAWATAIMYHADKEVGTGMPKFADESNKAAVTAQLSGSNEPCWRKKTANTPGFLRAS